MYFNKERFLEVIKCSDFCIKDLMIELGVSYKELWGIICGDVAVGRKQAERLLSLFGIWSVCWAMQDNHKWMPFALEAVANA